MWVIKLHKIKSKDYNYSKRALDRIGYQPRKIPAIIFVKALFYHILQNKSWRSVAKLVNTNHLVLYNFYKNYYDTQEIKKIFHYFIDSGVIVYIEQKGTPILADIRNNNNSITLTKRKLESIL